MLNSTASGWLGTLTSVSRVPSMHPAGTLEGITPGRLLLMLLSFPLLLVTLVPLLSLLALLLVVLLPLASAGADMVPSPFAAFKMLCRGTTTQLSCLHNHDRHGRVLVTWAGVSHTLLHSNSHSIRAQGCFFQSGYSQPDAPNRPIQLQCCACPPDSLLLVLAAQRYRPVVGIIGMAILHRIGQHTASEAEQSLLCTTT
jgi:hypothetical protein